MSRRIGVERLAYICARGHTTNQRADKPAPKRCAIHDCDERPLIHDAANPPKNKSETAHIGGLPVKKRTRKVKA